MKLSLLRWVMPLAIFAAWQTCPAKNPEIWIAQRTDGQKGRGTARDPYDGSTQAKFDKVLRGYWWRGTKNLTVHLTSGTFQTVGNGDYVAGLTTGTEGWRCNTGWTVAGAGQQATTLKIVKAFPSADGKTRHAAGIMSTDSSTTGITVQDLTVDCNYDQVGTKQSCDAGVGLQGSNHTIQRVTVINAAGWGAEAFPIGIGAVNIDSSDNLIQNCTISNWKGGTGGSITIGNNMNGMKKPVSHTSAVVQNNRVVGTHIAYGGFGMKNVSFSGNTAENCDYGVNIDSLRNQKITFTNNKFLACQSYGMVLGNCANFKIQGNTIDMPQGGQFILFLENSGYFMITGNTFTSANSKAALAAAQQPKTLFGKFIFSANTVSTTGGIQLPANLVQKD